jgi:disulfide bond formation protein DsbB
MTLLQRRGIGAATASALVLLTALGFQYLGGLAPCPLCLWQRWPHALAVVLGLLLLALPWRVLAGLGCLAMLTGAAIAAWHAGIEWGWWPGPTTCTAPADVSGVSAADLVAQLEAAPVVRCDEAPWRLAGLSMAGWNALISLGLALLWARAYASSSASQYR